MRVTRLGVRLRCAMWGRVALPLDRGDQGGEPLLDFGQRFAHLGWVLVVQTTPVCFGVRDLQRDVIEVVRQTNDAAAQARPEAWGTRTS